MESAYKDYKQSHTSRHLVSWFIAVAIIGVTFIGMEVLKVTIFSSQSTPFNPGVTYTAVPTAVHLSSTR